MSWAEEKTLEQFIKDTTGPNAGPMLFGNFPSNAQIKSATKTAWEEYVDETFLIINGSGWVTETSCKVTGSSTIGVGVLLQYKVSVYIDDVLESFLSPAVDITGPISNTNRVAKVIYKNDLLSILRGVGPEASSNSGAETYINAPVRFNHNLRVVFSMYSSDQHPNNPNGLIGSGKIDYVLDGGGRKLLTFKSQTFEERRNVA